jgi:RND family efflux transporter MFP subunit
MAMKSLRKTLTSTFWVALLVVAGWVLVALTTGALGSQASTLPPERLLPVGTVTAQLAESYPVERSFVGRVEAQRESDVGFELAGLVAKINVDDGASVRAGQVLASLDTELLEARREELVSTRAQARANLDLATKTRKRIKDLQARDFASSQDRDEAIEGVNVTQAALEKAGAAIRSIDVRIRKSQLRAPYDALVAARHIDEGQVIAAGVPVLRLYEDSEPEARIAIASDSVDRLREGDEYVLRIRDRDVPATLRTVLPKREASTRSVDAIFTLSVPFNGIRRGDLARLVLTERIVARGIELPLTALTESSRGIWAVYVAEPGTGGVSTLSRRQVELLHLVGEEVYVNGTLEAGEQVVRAGLHRLVPGQRVVASASHSPGELQ